LTWRADLSRTQLPSGAKIRCKGCNRSFEPTINVQPAECRELDNGPCEELIPPVPPTAPQQDQPAIVPPTQSSNLADLSNAILNSVKKLGATATDYARSDEAKELADRALDKVKQASSSAKEHATDLTRRARDAAVTSIPFWQRLFREICEIVGATARQTARLFGYGYAIARTRVLLRKARGAQPALGNRMYEAGVGDEAIRGQIASLDDRIANVGLGKGSTKQIEAEKQGLMLRLAADALAQDVAPTGAADEHGRAVSARNVVEANRSHLVATRVGLAPQDTTTWRRIGLGYGVVILALTFATSLLLRSANKPGLNQFSRTSAAPSFPVGKHTGLVGIGVTSVEGRMVIRSLTLGSPAQTKGIRLGDRLLGVGRTQASMIDVAGKTDEQVVNLFVGQAGDTVWLRCQRGNAADPFDVEVTRRERFDESKSQRVTWRKTGNSIDLPREFVEQFPGSPRKYAYCDNESKLLALPDQHAGERVAVVTQLLSPDVDSTVLKLPMFSAGDSPVGLVNRSKTPMFFEKLVINDPTRNNFVIMHLLLRQYRNSPALYGDVEEIMFLDDQARDCYQPLIRDQLEIGWKLPEGKSVSETVTKAPVTDHRVEFAKQLEPGVTNELPPHSRESSWDGGWGLSDIRAINNYLSRIPDYSVSSEQRGKEAMEIALLARRAKYSPEKTLKLLDAGIDMARRQGLLPVFGVRAAKDSIAFAAAWDEVERGADGGSVPVPRR
jgi:hypothetical protein